MVFPKPKIAAGIMAAAVVLTGSVWLAQRALADNAPHRASKLDLTPESMAAFRDLVRPADHEWRHLKVKWFTDIVEARKKAAKEDKPIFVFRTGGAGYNDPLGVC